MKINGFSLIEVLISLLLLSIVLLGLDGMEIYALRENRDAYYFSQAENQLQSMIERLRVAGPYSDLNQQIKIWNQQNLAVLPQGKGYVKRNFPTYNVTIFWGEKTNKRTCHHEMIKGQALKCLSEEIQL